MGLSKAGQYTLMQGMEDRGKALEIVEGFQERLAAIKVLDPACGSGNFLYLALKELKDLEKLVIAYAANEGLGDLTPRVGPEQLLGLEINVYARDLARTVVWIGQIQWHLNQSQGGNYILQRWQRRGSAYHQCVGSGL